MTAKKTIEELLESEYWVIDILPKQVPADAQGQYFRIEDYWLYEAKIAEIKKKHVGIILKLNCYLPVFLDDEAAVNPPPEKIEKEMYSRHLLIRVNDSLIMSEPDDTCLTVFAPDDTLLDLLRELSASEGMFLWMPSAV